jgi:hypothetical protein
MSLVLIFAENQSIFEGNMDIRVPSATLLGQSVVEAQVRMGLAAGCNAFIYYCESPDALESQAVAKLQRQGVAVDIVKTIEELVQALAYDKQIYVLGHGVIGDPVLLLSSSQITEDYLLTLTDAEELQEFERIDAESRWTGIARLSATLVQQAVQEHPEWELDSVVLRAALEKGVDRYRVELEGEAAVFLVKHTYQAPLKPIHTAVRRWLPRDAAGPWAHHVVAPLLCRVAPLCAEWTQVRILLFVLSMLFLLGFALLLLIGQEIAGFAAYVFGGVTVRLASYIGTVRRVPSVYFTWMEKVRLVLGALGLVTICLIWGRLWGWGYWALGGWLMLELARGFLTNPWYGQAAPGFHWKQTPDEVALILLISLVCGTPIYGLCAAIAYAAIGTIWHTGTQFSHIEEFA